MNPATLPAEFQDLAPYSDWALKSVQERVEKRIATPFDQLQNYYDLMLPRMKTIIEHLNTYTLAEMPEPEKNLFRMAASFIEASVAVELLGAPDEPGVFPIERITIERASIL